MSSRGQDGRLSLAGVLAAEAALVYVGFLSWDRERQVDALTGSTSGPYETWQVVATTVVLGLIAFTGGRAQYAWTAATAISVGFAGAWAIGAATVPTEDANLWPIGAVSVLIGTFVWTLLVALLARRLTRPDRVEHARR